MYPINYDLYLHPNIETGNFSGQERIQISVIESTDRIVLHSLYMEVYDLYITNSGSNTNFIKNYYFDGVREFLVIELSEMIMAPKNITLGLSFSGSMANKIIGLYSSSYLKPDNSRK